jgi:hypothetical protein
MHNLDSRHILLSTYAIDIGLTTFQLIGNFYVFFSIHGMATLHSTFSFGIVLVILPLPIFQYIPQSVGGEKSNTYHLP